MGKISTLDALPVGESAIVAGISCSGEICERFKELGLVNGTGVKTIQKSPSGSPVAYLFRGSVIALRREDAKKVIIEML
jgi:ferrous iron transport protein A